MLEEKNTLHSSLRILSHLWNMGVVSWFGLDLLHLGLIDGTIHSELYQQILKETSGHKRMWVMQQDNNPKHTSHSTKKWLKKS